LNFLAHLHLSDGTPPSMVGGLVADFVRQPEVKLLPAGVQEGIRLHRLIDAFTDRHPIVHGSIGRLGGEFGWFSGIVIDVYYDHILAREWSRYSAEPLRSFADRAYAALGGALSVVSEEVGRYVRGFIDDDRLVRYATTVGIADTLSRVSNRITRRMPRHALRLETAMPYLLAADVGLTADFHAFYPELIGHAASHHAANREPGGPRPRPTS
jgi:acyl carrier protein phosphodiesterase